MKHKQNGFTIVELLIVVVVIGILAAITIVAYNGIQARAEGVKNSSTASQFVKKIELWNTSLGYYPSWEQLLTNSVTPTYNGVQWSAGGAPGPLESKLPTNITLSGTYPDNGNTIAYIICSTPNKRWVIYYDPTSSNTIRTIPINNPPALDITGSSPVCS